MRFLFTLRVAAVLWCLLPAAISHSQTRGMIFDHLSIPEGLSQGTVFSILQDRHGFMWFGTADGLNTFDGYTFTHYFHDVSDSSSISDNRIISLLEDRAGRLWIGTIGGGLNLLDRETGKFRRYRSDVADSLSLSDDRVNSLFEDSHGTIWVGTTVAGLNAFDPATGRFRRFRHDPGDSTSLGSNHVFPILEDRDGTLWIGTPAGISLYDRTSDTFRRIRSDPADPYGLSHDYINALALDRSGVVWVGTIDGLNKFVGWDTLAAAAAGGKKEERRVLRPRFVRYMNDPGNPASLAEKSVWSIYEDRAGSLWVGTDGGGLNRLNRPAGTFERFLSTPSDPGSLSDNSVRSIYEDASGTLWVGTNLGGVNTWNSRRRKFTSYGVRMDSTLGVSSNWIHAIHEDRKGRVWVGSSAQVLDLFDPASGTFRHIAVPGSVDALCENSSGSALWVGTRTGLYTIDVESLRLRKVEFAPPDPDSLSSRRVRVLETDHARNLWMGLFRRGIAVFRPADRSVVQFTNDPLHPGSISDDLVRTIHRDHSGVIWVGTYAGLDRFEPETRTFSHFRHDPRDQASLSNSNILSLFDFPADSGRVLWVGTFGGGLNRLDVATGRATRYTTRNGLPNNVIYGILGDGRGRLWITTNRGAARLDPSTGEVRTFDISDGLQGNEFSVGAFHSGRSALMYFGGVGGFSVLHPDSIEANTYVPPTVITTINTPGRPLRPQESSVELRPGEKYITIEFAALDYTNPPKNRYAYRLQGFDDQWTEVGTRRSVSFTNLDAGDYLFEVKGSNSDGLWNDHPASLRIVVVPPFWRSTWFILLSACAAVLLGTAFYRRRRAADIEKARLLGELQAARAVQLGLLPAADPMLEGLEISGACIPAQEVGGDFFEYLAGNAGESRLSVALGDVSGRGMNAAMTAVMAIGMLHREREIAAGPAAMLRHINTTLYAKTDKRLFVAMLVASFESQPGSMVFANAGQPLPIRIRRGKLTPLTGKGERLPLGVRERVEYQDCTVDLQPGDILVFTSDGVTDARREDGTFLDEEGLRKTACGLPPELSAREMVQRIVRAVQEATGARQLHDDVTVVVAKVLGKS